MLIEKRAREAEIVASRIVDECERRSVILHFVHVLVKGHKSKIFSNYII